MTTRSNSDRTGAMIVRKAVQNESDAGAEDCDSNSGWIEYINVIVIASANKLKRRKPRDAILTLNKFNTVRNFR